MSILDKINANGSTCAVRSGKSIVVYPVTAGFKEAKAKWKNPPDFAEYKIKFDQIKNRLTNDLHKDIDTWAKKPWATFVAFVDEEVSKQSRSAVKRQAKAEGSTLIYETEKGNKEKGILVYNITSFKAAKLIGDNTDWCITRSETHWDSYSKDACFYFLIKKGASRANDVNYKVAAQVKEDTITYWDASDKSTTKAPAFVTPAIKALLKPKSFVLIQHIKDGTVPAGVSGLALVDAIKKYKIKTSDIHPKVLGIKTSFGTVKAML